MKAFGTTRDRDLWERKVNQHFGAAQPILSPEESIAAAKKLYRTVMGHAFSGVIKLTSGNRYTWVKVQPVRQPGGGYARKRVMSVNPDHRELSARGLRALIHDLSHYCHGQLHPNDAPHSRRQAQLEGRMVRAALARGFLEGKLKPKEKAEPEPKVKPDKVQQRYARMIARRDKYAGELERSKRLLAKVQKEVREYERRHGERVKETA
jgi:hypothetical protein